MENFCGYAIIAQTLLVCPLTIANPALSLKPLHQKGLWVMYLPMAPKLHMGDSQSTQLYRACHFFSSFLKFRMSIFRI